jgi:Phage terminase large subunit (GpA)
LPGKVRLWPYQRAIADAISDPLIERITLVKSARLGFTTLLTGAIGHFVVDDPSSGINSPQLGQRQAAVSGLSGCHSMARQSISWNVPHSGHGTSNKRQSDALHPSAFASRNPGIVGTDHQAAGLRCCFSSRIASWKRGLGLGASSRSSSLLC